MNWPLAVAFGRSCQSATTQLLQPLAKPSTLIEHRAIDPALDFSAHTGGAGGMYRLSRCVPLAHEDKTFQDAHHPAIKASLDR
jgi:glucoamylase